MRARPRLFFRARSGIKVPADQGSVPDVEALTGRARAEAMVKKAFDEDLFDRDALQFQEEGTRENPIPILSAQDERIVGISLPVRCCVAAEEAPPFGDTWAPLRPSALALRPPLPSLHRPSQDDAEIRWFTLKKGMLAYDPDTCNFFALKQVRWRWGYLAAAERDDLWRREKKLRAAPFLHEHHEGSATLDLTSFPGGGTVLRSSELIVSR